MATFEFLEFITGDAIMPPDTSSEEEVVTSEPEYDYPEEVYSEPEEEETEEEQIETEAPTQAPTQAETQAVVAATEPAVKTNNNIFSDPLVLTILIVVPLLLATIITVCVLLVRKNSQKNQAPMNNIQGHDDPYQNHRDNDHNDPRRF